MGDWSSPIYITSQVLVCLAYVLLAFTYFITRRRVLLFTTISSNLVMGAGFMLLHGWVAVCMCAIAICRDVTSSIVDARRKPSEAGKSTRLDWILLCVWISAFTVATALTQSGFMSLFAYFATMTFTVSIWQKNPLVYRVMGIFVGLFWLIYNVEVASVMGLALEGVLLVFVIGGLVSYIKKGPKPPVSSVDKG
ncbi:MAG: YgjV family protein [Rickettsiales bacterium]|jgi:hypothetical protein|nr:YgjV family protein [Rickettsiales bacterium]